MSFSCEICSKSWKTEKGYNNHKCKEFLNGFIVEFNDTATLKKIFDLSTDLYDEGMIRITDEELIISMKGPSAITVYAIRIPKHEFIKFELDREHKITISFTDLDKILKRAKNNDIIIFMYDESKRKFTLRIGSSNNRIRNFNLQEIEDEKKYQIDIDFEKLDSIPYTIHFSLDPSFFLDILKDAVLYSEDILFYSENETLIFESVGNTGSFEAFLGDDDLESLDIKEDFSVKCSIKFLKHVFKYIDLIDSVNTDILPDNIVHFRLEIDDSDIITDYWIGVKIDQTLEDDEDFEDLEEVD